MSTEPGQLQLDTSDVTLARANQVQVRDPLWMLARQWQVGEFAGMDRGSPISATYQLQQLALTSYQTAQAQALAQQQSSTGSPITAPPQSFSLADPPLEVQVEREPFPLGLRGSIQLGLRFEAMAAQVGATAAAIEAVRTACGISATPTTNELPDPKARAIRTAVAGRVTDGVQLFQAIMNGTPLPPIPAAATTTFKTYCQSLYSLPVDPANATPAFDSTDLDFEFFMSAEVTGGTTVGLTASDYDGEVLDWFWKRRRRFEPLAAPEN